MGEFGYPLSRASRWRARARLPRYTGSLVGGLAIALVALGLERTLDIPRPGVADALASPSPGEGSRVTLPIDRVLTVSDEILGRTQAPDIWSTPLRAGLEPEVNPQLLFAGVPKAGERAPASADLFGPVSLIDGRKPDGATPNTPAPSASPPAPAPGPVTEARPPAPPVASEATQAEPKPSSVTTASLPGTPADTDQDGDDDAPAPRVTPAAPAPTLRLSGKWGATRSACTPGRGKDELLPLVLGPKGARAGDATCRFNRTVQNGNRWSIAASCRHGRESWRAHVKLTMAGNRLTWSSERGTQAYIRCN